MGSFEFVKVRAEEQIAVITLDNPPVNALNLKVLGELEEAVGEAEKNPEIRGVIITGAGTNAFCAGADVKMIHQAKPEEAASIVREGQRVFNRVENLSKVVVAAINGLTLGGGCELAMACDIRIASDRARFGQPEVALGLIPAWGGTQRLPRIVGKGKAKELIFTGQIISAQEAYRIGLVNKIVPDGEELRASIDMLRLIGTKVAPLAVRAAKKAINEGLTKPSLEEALKVEVEALIEVAKTEDLREGLEAFLQKRPPKYQGR